MFRLIVFVSCCVVLCVGYKTEPRCGVNEVYTDCKESCPPEVCFSISAFYDCSDAEPCTKGCACKPGYLRKNMDTPCVPTCKCPQRVNAPECIAKEQEAQKELKEEHVDQ